ncbi:MAG: hypothetical protein KF884_12875 [Fimbriimonadaceae bacterium]|nr:hypothetical protein [Fimbriimonadaceae bacterium]QYK58435.1 MAG: hypothetical protein KF884_12875 [Fimbriimonadaceae bacterium]
MVLGALLGLSLLGCGGSIREFFERALVSPSTRSLSGLGDRLKFRFLEGTFDKTVTFLLSQVLGVPTIPAMILADAIEFKVQGAAPQKPMEIQVAYSPSSFEGQDEGTLKLWRLVDGRAILVPGSQVDTVRKTVRGDVIEDGVYAVGATLAD